MIRKLKAFAILLFVLIAGGGFWLFTRMQEGLTIRISDGQINTALSRSFPLEKTHLAVVKTTLAQPRVILIAGQDRVRIETRVTAGTTFGKLEIGSLKVGSEEEYEASALIDGEVDYDPAKGEFFFKDASLLALDIDKVPEKIRDPVREAVGVIARQALNRLPVYTLQEGDMKFDVARLVLREVRIEDGRLAVTMKLPEGEPSPVERNK